jgi:glutamate--cysteine ligase
MQTNRETYYATAMGMAKQQRELFVQRPLDNQRLAHYRELAAASHRQQLAIEGADSKTFDQFLADYWQSSRR